MRLSSNGRGSGRASVVGDWLAVCVVLATIFSVTLAIAAVG